MSLSAVNMAKGWLRWQWALLCVLAVGTVRAAERPNILWICADDLSPQLGCYGDETVPTPNIDRLAAEGVRYTRAFATYAVGAPNRTTLMLGLYPTSMGAMHQYAWKRGPGWDEVTDKSLLEIPTYEAVPPSGVKLLSEYLRSVGYYCTSNLKDAYQFRTPVTVWDDSGETAHWSHRPTPETPFFSVIHLGLGPESGLTLPSSEVATTAEVVAVPPYYPETSEVRRALARHYRRIGDLDRRVGLLVAELERDGLLERTIIFFFGGNGAALPRAKGWIYDSGIRVPLIIRYPDLQNAGSVESELVSFIDFAPSVLSLLSLPIPDYMHGQAFLGGQKATPRRYVFAFRDRVGPALDRVRAVRGQRFKYVRNYRPDLPFTGMVSGEGDAPILGEIQRSLAEAEAGGDRWQFFARQKPLEELYDTESDPHEIANLAGDPRHFEKLFELRGIHDAFQKLYGDLGALAETNLVKTLWPPNGEQPITSTPILSVVTDGDEAILTLEAQTPGASLGYRMEGESTWQLYSRPVTLPAGSGTEAVAHRLGYQPSEVVRYQPPGRSE